MGYSVKEQVWWVAMVVILLGFKGGEGCLKEEREGLKKLKEAFNYPNGSSLPSWNNLTRSDCCGWEGVHCDNFTGRVRELLLNYTRGEELRGIKWFLNATYFHPFHQLLLLDLSGNYLSGLVGEIRLSNLQYLNFRDNRLEEISSLDLSYLRNLEVLTFRNNYLTGSLPPQGGLCNLKNLEVLVLSQNYFEGPLPTCLSNLTSLRLLDVHENGFEGTLPSSLFDNLTSLRSLDVHENSFEGTLPSSLFYNLRSLEYIALAENYFSGSFSLSLLANLSNLQVFGISCSKTNLKLEIENHPFLPSFQLKVLRVFNCSLSRASNNRIPGFLFHQYDLRSLQLAYLNISGNFPNWLLKNNTKLSYFDLSHNFLTAPLELNFTSKFLYMRYFEVSSNPIKGEIPSYMGSVFPNLIALNMSSSSLHGGFPASIGDMRQLNYLDLSNNNLSGYLPQQFGKRSNDLRFLKLSNNNLSGPCLPVGSNLTHLLSMDLNNNNFEGKVPDGIINSLELRMLDLSANQLFGEMPNWIGNFQYLSYLILSQNALAGSIPESFCNLIELTYLDFSYNRFNGTLPSCLKMPLLRSLHLHSNDFTGPIPSILAKSSLLLTLDLTKNRFTGQIPRWFKSFLNLRVLILKENKFEGSIPIDLCKIKNLSILDISQNKLSGGIPYCLNNITFGRRDALDGIKIGKFVVPWTTRAPLATFNLTSGEVIEGEQDVDFAWYGDQEVNFMSKSRYESYEGNILDFMSGLDLSNNCLTGEIPSQIGYLNTIHTLNLSNNCLTGPIPQTFFNLKQIESLDLSHNKLTGHIPAQLTELYSLSVFSVAYNNLSGTTPDRKSQFSTFEENCYEGNPFLCGPPLQQNCSSIDRPAGRNKLPSHLGKSDFRDSFLWTFAGTFGVAFVSVIVFLYFSSYFSN